MNKGLTNPHTILHAIDDYPAQRDRVKPDFKLDSKSFQGKFPHHLLVCPSIFIIHNSREGSLCNYGISKEQFTPLDCLNAQGCACTWPVIDSVELQALDTIGTFRGKRTGKPAFLIPCENSDAITK